MGKYQEITEFAPKILKMGEIYTDSKMCWLEALHMPNVTAHFLADLTKMAGVKQSALQSKIQKCSLRTCTCLCLAKKQSLSVQNCAQHANLSV